MACEICEKPTEAICGGLDVPMRGFCEKHGREHAAICPDVLAGRATVEYPLRGEQADERESSE